MLKFIRKYILTLYLCSILKVSMIGGETCNGGTIRGTVDVYCDCTEAYGNGAECNITTDNTHVKSYHITKECQIMKIAWIKCEYSFVLSNGIYNITIKNKDDFLVLSVRKENVSMLECQDLKKVVILSFLKEYISVKLKYVDKNHFFIKNISNSGHINEIHGNGDISCFTKDRMPLQLNEPTTTPKFSGSSSYKRNYDSNDLNQTIKSIPVTEKRESLNIYNELFSNRTIIDVIIILGFLLFLFREQLMKLAIGFVSFCNCLKNNWSCRLLKENNGTDRSCRLLEEHNGTDVTLEPLIPSMDISENVQESVKSIKHPIQEETTQLSRIKVIQTNNKTIIPITEDSNSHSIAMIAESSLGQVPESPNSIMELKKEDSVFQPGDDFNSCKLQYSNQFKNEHCVKEKLRSSYPESIVAYANTTTQEKPIEMETFSPDLEQLLSNEEKLCIVLTELLQKCLREIPPINDVRNVVEEYLSERFHPKTNFIETLPGSGSQILQTLDLNAIKRSPNEAQY